MKQSRGLHLFLVSTLFIQLVTLLCQVQGGIITNQQTLTLPKELADSIASATNTASSSDDATADSGKNASRTGRVMYTAPYSNVRISSKEPKSLKYFPIPAVISKKHVPSPTVIVPVLRTSTSTEATTTTSTTTASTTTTSTTTTTTTTPPPPPPSTSAAEVQADIPDVIEILEEIEPSSDDEVVTETITGGNDLQVNNDNDDDNDDDTDKDSIIAVTEQGAVADDENE